MCVIYVYIQIWCHVYFTNCSVYHMRVLVKTFPECILTEINNLLPKG